MSEFKSGDRVLVQRKFVGTVRYFGHTKFKEGVWVGIELDTPNGKNNGIVEGEKYFQCSPGYGLFIRPEHLVMYNEKMLAASAVQSHVRKFLAKKKVNAIQAARTWNVLDNHNEDVGMRRGRVIEIATKELRMQNQGTDREEDVDDVSMENLTVEELHHRASEAVDTMSEQDVVAIRVGSDYQGPHLDYPITLRSVLNMMDELKKNHTLHYKYLLLLFLKCRKLFMEEKTVQEIKIDDETKVTVVGDIHGQLQDLFTIFNINQIPSKNNWYLFNGDFIDRGPSGCEVLATICALKILYPKYVFLNRGNHEARAQNAWMGFEEEVLTKYCAGDNPAVPRGDRIASLKLYMLCQSMFDNLPLCAVIQERIFICHGGLFRNDGVTLNHLRKISRKREPPLEGRSFEDRIYEDLIWSDPRPTSTYPRALELRRPSDRGAGCEFGPMVTHEFCSRNQIALVVRSHECVPEGFELLHNGRLITIFSASRYCGTQTNKGAFITFNSTLQPEIQQFYAHSMEESSSFMTEEERETKLESDAIHMIVEHICDKRLDLYWYFTQNDEEHTGFVSRIDWSTALQNVLGLDIPFLHYQPQLATCDDQGNINYSVFLSRFQVQMREQDTGWQDAIVRRVCQKLYALVGSNLEGAYEKFDTNKDGYIEYEEFVKTLKSLDVGLSEQQIYELMRSVDVNDDAHIDFREFAKRFEVVFKSIHLSDVDTEGSGNRGRAVSVEELEAKANSELSNSELDEASLEKLRLNWSMLDDWTLQNILEIAKAIYRTNNNLSDAFRSFDKENSGSVTPDGFIVALKEIGIDLKVEDAQKLFKVVDANESGTINYNEFVDAFQVRDSDPRSESWKQGVIQQVANVLYQHRIHLRAAFRIFDNTNSGIISAEEFQEGMDAVNKLLSCPLTNIQIEELRKALDRNSDGRIDYKEFFEGLCIQDTLKGDNTKNSNPDSPKKKTVKKTSSYMAT